jgi:hypothetical protein
MSVGDTQEVTHAAIGEHERRRPAARADRRPDVDLGCPRELVEGLVRVEVLGAKHFVDELPDAEDGAMPLRSVFARGRLGDVLRGEVLLPDPEERQAIVDVTADPYALLWWRSPRLAQPAIVPAVGWLASRCRPSATSSPS